MRFTIFGADGFIGSALVKKLNDSGADVWCPTRQDLKMGMRSAQPLGHVIYAIGRTADFRTRLSDTIDAHVNLLDYLLNSTKWDSWLYLSSTRVYGQTAEGTRTCESEPLRVTPGFDGVYNISKILGEALCLARPEDSCRVARISNVFGPQMPCGTFLSSLISEATETGRVIVKESADSCKDYISVNTVSRYLLAIAASGKHRIYNVATGANISHSVIAEALERSFGTPAFFEVDGPQRKFPIISVNRVISEFGLDDQPLNEQLDIFLKNSRAGIRMKP